MKLWRLFLFFIKIVKSNYVDLDLPYKYFLVVTKSCQSKCKHCLIWTEKVQDELTFAEYEAIAKNSKDNLFWLNISGGEPTDREDLVDILKIFVKFCPRLCIINFTSNGLNYESLEKVARYLNESKIPIIGINISIDGDEKVHNKIRGRDDSFEKGIRSLKMLQRYSRLNVFAAFTINPLNISLIESTIKEVEERIPNFNKKQWHINLPHTSSHYYNNEESKVNLIDFSLKDYLQKVHSLNSPIQLLERIYRKSITIFQSTGKTPINCASMASNIYISEKGEVYPCTIWNNKIGGLRENQYDLSKVLKVSTSKDLRKMIKMKKCPQCWTPCEAFPSMLGDIRGVVWNYLAVFTRKLWN